MDSVNIYPELTKWRKGKQGQCPITIRFDFNRSRVGNQSIDHSIKPEDWDMTLKRVKKSNRDHELINLILETLLNRHKNYFLKRKAFGLSVTRELVKKYITNGGTLDCFYTYAESVIENKTLKDGKPYSTETKRCYRDEIRRLQQYSQELNFRNLNQRFLEGYKLWLQNDYRKAGTSVGLDQNSIWKALKFIRMVYNEAVKNDIIPGDENPFKKFQVGACVEKTDKIKYLEREDLEKLERALNSGSGLQDLTIRIGWRFLAMCVSGLRISDAMNLDDMFFNDKGDLEFTPHKTRRHGNKAQVPIISDRQKEYLQKTMALPLPKTDPKNFRTTFNIHLKILGAAAGVKTNLTSHVGRHTMGSFLVDAGVETKVAMAILGVRREKVIQTYMHLKESKLQAEAKKLKNVF